VEEEVEEDEDVDEEDGEEDGDEAAGRGGVGPGGVFLGSDRGVEVLGLSGVEDGGGVVL
jgi:hypothetical protein